MQIEQLVANLPEIYQPIYGYPELSENVSRVSHDRLEIIVEIYKKLEKELGRPLKVLDLGCAQGFFSFNLAKIGAEVVGLDYGKENVSLCRQLAEENSELDIDFKIGNIQEFVTSLKDSTYDLVLGLSVFHHITHEYGKEYVKGLINYLSKRTKVLILEFALSDEPVYWAKSQPEDPFYFIDEIEFYNQVGRFSTHLSSFNRPMYFASNNFWYLGNQLSFFEFSTSKSHSLVGNAYQGSRRYYFSDKHVLKIFELVGSLKNQNYSELLSEENFLKKPPEGFDVPKIINSGQDSNRAWLAMEKIPGELLLDLIKKKINLNTKLIILDILKQLSILEKNGLYHSDIRSWNIIVDQDRARIIDFGSISSIQRDCVWPTNLFLSFFIFLNEVINGIVEKPDPIRKVALNSLNFSEPYRSWLIDFWKKPLKEWSFETILISFENIVFDEKGSIAEIEPKDLWMQAIENALDIHTKQLQYLQHNITSFDEFVNVTNPNQVIAMESFASKIEETSDQISIVKNKLDNISQSQREYIDSQNEKLNILESRLNAVTADSFKVQNELNTILNSKSWSLTAPLRLLKFYINKFTNIFF